MKKAYIYLVLSNFLLASLFGVILRSYWVSPLVNLNYTNILHAHSHIALLGWLYLLIYLLFTKLFVDNKLYKGRFFKGLFWVSQVSIWLMAVTFPFTGYGFWSIFACSVQVLCSFIFAYKVYKNLDVSDRLVKYFVRMSLFFLVFCSLGLWALGPLTAMLGKSSLWPTLAIQFFLHFQFEGWFICAIVALWCHYSRCSLQINNKSLLLWLYFLSVIFSFSTTVGLLVQHPLLRVFSLLGICLQILVMAVLIVGSRVFIAKQIPLLLRSKQLLLVVFLVCSSLRIAAQISTVIPYVYEHMATLRSWIIGFIHLNMLGVITCFGLLLCFELGFLKINLYSRLGIKVLSGAIIVTELVLFWQGFCLLIGRNGGMSSEILYYFAFLFPLSILFLMGSKFVK